MIKYTFLFAENKNLECVISSAVTKPHYEVCKLNIEEMRELSRFEI